MKDHGRKVVARVHRVVMEAFVGPCPDGMEVCHGDGDPMNARLDNLRYDTRKANHADKKRHGTSNSGSRHGNSKLTEDQVLRMRSNYAKGIGTYKSLSDEYEVHIRTICQHTS